MSDIPSNEQECQQDILQRVHKWLTVLEERAIMLLHAHDPTDMKPGECEQAVNRHVMMMVRLLQLRQQYTQGRSVPGEQALLEVLRGMDDGSVHAADET